MLISLMKKQAAAATGSSSTSEHIATVSTPEMTYILLPNLPDKAILDNRFMQILHHIPHGLFNLAVLLRIHHDADIVLVIYQDHMT